MRFLMKTLRARQASRLIHAFRQNLFGCAWALAAVFVSLAKPRSRHPRLLARHNYSSQSFGASSSLLFKAAGCWHAKIRIQNRSLPRLCPIAPATFPRRSSTSGIGFVHPSSRSPQPPQSEITLSAAETYSTQGYFGDRTLVRILLIAFCLLLPAKAPQTSPVPAGVKLSQDQM